MDNNVLDSFQTNENESEKTNNQNVFVILLSAAGILLVIFVGFILWNQSALKDRQGNVGPSDDTEVVATTTVTSESVFGLTLVPDAVERITLPALPDNADESDTTYYRAVKTRIENANLSSSNQAFESPYTLGVGPATGLQLVNQHESRELLLQAHDELLLLTEYYNNELDRQNPVERGIADAVTPPYEAAVWTVAPSSHVVLALFFGDILMQTVEESAQASITQTIDDFIDRGVVYGLYTESDIETSRALYAQYKIAVIENYPLLQNAF